MSILLSLVEQYNLYNNWIILLLFYTVYVHVTHFFFNKKIISISNITKYAWTHHKKNISRKLRLSLNIHLQIVFSSKFLARMRFCYKSYNRRHFSANTLAPVFFDHISTFLTNHYNWCILQQKNIFMKCCWKL